MRAAGFVVTLWGMTDRPSNELEVYGYPLKPKRLKAGTKQCDEYRSELEAVLKDGHIILESRRGIPYVAYENGVALNSHGFRPASGLPAFGNVDPAVKERFLATLKADQKMQKQIFMKGYAEAVRQFAPEMVELHDTVYKRALEPDADSRDVSIAVNLMKDTVDRLGAKPTQHVEVEGGGLDDDSFAARIAAKAKQARGWTPPPSLHQDVVVDAEVITDGE